jgi:nucleoside phosphorylase
MSVDVLLLAAFHPELAALRPHLVASGEGMAGRIGGLEVSARAVGIGLPAAAVGAATRVASMKPRAVVLLGTCGAYAPRMGGVGGSGGSGRELAIGDIAIARRVRLVDPAAIEGRAAFPDPMSLVSEANASVAAALEAHASANSASAPHAALVDLATTLAVTTDDALAARVGRESRCDAEHLEAYAVALACAAHGVPFVAALGVANVVGSRAREEWRVNHRAASDAAIDLVLSWLRAGAPGLPALAPAPAD